MSSRNSSSKKNSVPITKGFSNPKSTSDARENIRTTAMKPRGSTTSTSNPSTTRKPPTTPITMPSKRPIIKTSISIRSNVTTASSRLSSSRNDDKSALTSREPPIDVSMTRCEKSVSATQKTTSDPKQPPSKQLGITFVLLDKDVDNEPNKYAAQQQLRRTVDHLEVFKNCHDCVDYIQSAEDQRIILFVSSDFAEKVIPVLHDLIQLIECYIYAPELVANKNWTIQYDKVKEIITDVDGLVAKMTEKAKIIQENYGPFCSSCNTIPMMIYSRSKIGNITIQQQRNERNANFMYFLLLIDILLKISRLDTKSGRDLIEYSREMCENNNEELEKIKKFQCEYKSTDAISWYTDETFLYRLMNKAIRDQDYDAIFSYRMCITDLHNELTKEHERFRREYTGDPIIRVYRGQVISNDELDLIRNSIDQFISINTFLSTSRDEDVALYFAKKRKTTDSLSKILYRFKIDTRITNTPAYAPIENMSRFQVEDEFLISLGSIFKIEDVMYDEDNQIWTARLALCEKDVFELKDIMARVKEDIGDDIIGLGYLLIHQDKFDKARQCFHQFLDEPLIGDFDKAQCYRGLGSIAFYEDNYEDALAYYHEAFRLINDVRPNDNESNAVAHRCLAEVYQWMNDQDLAFYHANKAQSLLPDNNTVEMAKVYSIIANILRNEKRLLDALDYYNRVLYIRIHFLPSYHPDIAITHNNIAAIHNDMGNYAKALESLSTSLDIKRKALPPGHHSILETEANIKVIQVALDDDDDDDDDQDGLDEYLE